MYCQARHALHTQLTDSVVGRDEEVESLTQMIESALENKKPESIYVSGEFLFSTQCVFNGSRRQWHRSELVAF